MNTYLEFHYANTLEHFARESGVREQALGFAARVTRGALDALDGTTRDGSRRETRALDVGCAVGASAFHLATKFDEVVAFDYSKAFVDTCLRMRSLRDGESVRAETRGAGDETVSIDCYRPCSYERAQRVKFHQGDACEMVRDAEFLGTFDCVILANLLCRLPRPRACLDGLRAVVRPGGNVFIFTPWSWLDEYTPDVNERITPETLEREMNERGFKLAETWEEPCFIREHSRKAQYIVSQGWHFTRPERESPQ